MRAHPVAPFGRRVRLHTPAGDVEGDVDTQAIDALFELDGVVADVLAFGGEDDFGGSAAGVYVDNEVRAASLFRGVPPDVFDQKVRRLFFTLQERWGGVPFEVLLIDDGSGPEVEEAFAAFAPSSIETPPPSLPLATSLPSLSKQIWPEITSTLPVRTNGT